MADVLVLRLQPTPPFAYCIVDYLGQTYVRQGRSDIKHYRALFACIVWRALFISKQLTILMQIPLSKQCDGVCADMAQSKKCIVTKALTLLVHRAS